MSRAGSVNQFKAALSANSPARPILGRNPVLNFTIMIHGSVILRIDKPRKKKKKEKKKKNDESE